MQAQLCIIVKYLLSAIYLMFIIHIECTHYFGYRKEVIGYQHHNWGTNI